MDPLQLDTANRIEPNGFKETYESSIVGADDCGSAADLIALVQQALDVADAKGFIFVGIDLCSALERLKEMDDTARFKECRVQK
jgi:hypothetical protein